ncbi:MAG: MIP/aquaporin family protein [Planctomycetota bacterium]
MHTLRSYAAEFLGTFILVFVGTGAVIIDSITEGTSGLAGIALAWGLVVAAMIYAFGDVSGAHINPAVTIALCLAKRFPFSSVVPYVIVQCLGAITASSLLRILYPDQLDLGMTLPAGVWWQSFVLEVVLTGILMLVILNVTASGKDNGITPAIAIGGVISFEVLCGGPISGASMNPARSLAPALISGDMSSLWIYLTAPVLGSVLAVPITVFLGGDTLVASESEADPDPNQDSEQI